MIKKDYMKPVMRIVELRQKHQILVGSLNAYGMNTQLRGRNNSEEEVEQAW